MSRPSSSTTLQVVKKCIALVSDLRHELSEAFQREFFHNLTLEFKRTERMMTKWRKTQGLFPYVQGKKLYAGNGESRCDASDKTKLSVDGTLEHFVDFLFRGINHMCDVDRSVPYPGITKPVNSDFNMEYAGVIVDSVERQGVRMMMNMAVFPFGPQEGYGIDTVNDMWRKICGCIVNMFSAYKFKCDDNAVVHLDYMQLEERNDGQYFLSLDFSILAA